jgi:LysM repeat protein
VAAAANVDYEALIAALQQCIGYIEGDFLTVGENICLPPYSTSCRYVSPAGQDENCKVYNVQQGDTMASIAASFNIDLAAFQEINQDVAAPERPVRPGQRLRLPPWGSDCPELTAMLTSCQVYAARSGDTLSSIASVFRTTVEEIIAVNAGMSPIGVLSPGQPVKIPPFPAACREGNLVTGPSNEGVTVCRAYQVQVGDSIDSIAGDFGLNTDDVVDLNRELEDAAKVTPGMIIKLPPWEENCPVEGMLVSSPSSMNTSSSSALEESNSTSSRPPPAPTPSASPMPININPAGTPRIPGPVPGPALPAAAAAPTPAPAVIVPLNSLEVEVVVLGSTIAGLEKTKASLLFALTSAAHVPSSNVSVIEGRTNMSACMRDQQLNGALVFFLLLNSEDTIASI